MVGVAYPSGIGCYRFDMTNSKRRFIFYALGVLAMRLYCHDSILKIWILSAYDIFVMVNMCTIVGEVYYLNNIV